MDLVGGDVTIPICKTPVSDQTYAFVLANTEMRDEMAIPPLIRSCSKLSSTSGVRWSQRVLPIYTHGGDLLLPKYYHSLVGALCEVDVVAMRLRGNDGRDERFYLQVKGMKILQEGTTSR